MELGGVGMFWTSVGVLGVGKSLGFKEHLNWLKIDFDAAEIITVEDYNKKKYEWKYTYTVFTLRAKQVIYESNI